jgi:hypothetical protein
MCQIRIWSQGYEGSLCQGNRIAKFFAVNLDFDFPDTLLDLLTHLPFPLLGLGLLAKTL